MKLSIEQVQELAEFHKRYQELQSKICFWAIGSDYVQLEDDVFTATFPTYVATKRVYCDIYSHDLSTVAGGVRFIAITNNEEYIRGHEHESS